MRFADFYAGAGGWTLGLSLAGHEAVFSAEIWKTANAARAWNFGTPEALIDVRKLDPREVPDCDLIVGSPPCTQFSYANRGGNGDIDDGLEDVRAFLRVVEAKKPRNWVMENVPRLTGILDRELAPGGALEGFAHLFGSIDDFDMSDWGVPQRRRRCIAGRYPRELLLSLRGRKAPSLGDVLSAVQAGRDPVWGGHAEVTDNDPGFPLSWEESRINEEKKRNHPIYNDMAFPDDQARPARTVTATCTKVSRESIVVPCEQGFRLLSVRESAAVQSFPISYQFPSRSRSDRIKMAGNAIPPLFTYMIGLAVLGETVPGSLPQFAPAGGKTPDAPPEGVAKRGKKAGRPFRAAIKGLRFKSGMSFELRNGSGGWEVAFNAGNSLAAGSAEIAAAASKAGQRADMAGFSGLGEAMQAAWEESRDCEAHPFRVADRIGAAAAAVVEVSRAVSCVEALYAAIGHPMPDKAARNAHRIAAGVALADGFNRAVRECEAAAA